jgi:hypothetical protein
MRKWVLIFVVSLLAASNLSCSTAAQVAATNPEDARVEEILGQYVMIQESLAADSTKGVDTAAARIAALAEAAETADPQTEHFFHEVKKSAEAVTATDIEAVRQQFFELSKPLMAYLKDSYSGQKDAYRYFCSMADKGWIQAELGPRNPYYGASMLKCGELVK